MHPDLEGLHRRPRSSCPSSSSPFSKTSWRGRFQRRGPHRARRRMNCGRRRNSSASCYALSCGSQTTKRRKRQRLQRTWQQVEIHQRRTRWRRNPFGVGLAKGRGCGIADAILRLPVQPSPQPHLKPPPSQANGDQAEMEIESVIVIVSVEDAWCRRSDLRVSCDRIGGPRHGMYSL